MAIEKSYFDSRVEVMLNDCYWKVGYISGNKSLMLFKVFVYRNRNRADMGFPLLAEYEYEFIPELDDVNFIAQAYNHLKTLDEFAGCRDV